MTGDNTLKHLLCLHDFLLDISLLFLLSLCSYALFDLRLRYRPFSYEHLRSKFSLHILIIHLSSSLVNRFCEKDTVRSGNSERPNFICPGALSISHKSAQTSQLPLPVPCKRSSAAPIPFGFQLSVARSRRFALPVTARSAPCGFVPLRQS